MTSASRLEDYPERLAHSLKRPELVHVRTATHFAVQAGGRPEGFSPLVTWDNDGVSVFALPPGGAPPPVTGELLAVYRVGESRSLAVPTGKIWLAFVDAVLAAERQEAIEGAGYRIEAVPVWAPSCAWVRHASGSAAASLRDVERLVRLDDVEDVEPQVLTHRSLRGGAAPAS